MVVSVKWYLETLEPRLNVLPFLHTFTMKGAVLVRPLREPDPRAIAILYIAPCHVRRS